MNKKTLRVGRVYHIKPEPIPPMEAKEREAVFVGRRLVYGKQMPVFIQMGKTPYFDSNFQKFYNDTGYFWDKLGREGYFHIAVSKPEFSRVVVNSYTKNGGYIDLKRGDAKKLFALWEAKIDSLKDKRWKKSYAMFLLGKEGEALKQLYLLKYTMPWEYKFLKPTKQIEKWNKKD